MRPAVAVASFAIWAIAAAVPAAAQPPSDPPRAGDAALPAHRGVDYVLVDPAPLSRARDPDATDVLYLNRCASGCTVTRGDDSAPANTSSAIRVAEARLSPFRYSDEVWNAVVGCVRDTYRPYDVAVVTDEPTGGTPYVEVMVAGSPQETGWEPDTLGVAPMARDCSPQVNWIAFAFANVHGSNPVIELCATVAHEAGHVYGLDHEYDCKDPMTYLTGCGQKHFLNLALRCGEFDGPRDCRCGATQNSHVHLRAALGAGQLPPPPEVTIPYPADGDPVIDGFSVFGRVDEPRITTRVEFWFNDWPWHTAEGRRDLTTYSFATPQELPDGIIDVEVRAYNDLDVMGAASVTVHKGEPCTSASACLAGQRCEDGRCAWPPPSGEVGDRCSIDADCISRLCESDGEHTLCSARCTPGLAGDCPEGFVCLAAADSGRCWPEGLGGGCCSAAGGDPLWPLGLAALVGLRRWRRRRPA
jgi:MYXO-CTERM domain-containing protein